MKCCVYIMKCIATQYITRLCKYCVVVKYWVDTIALVPLFVRVTGRTIRAVIARSCSICFEQSQIVRDWQRRTGTALYTCSWRARVQLFITVITYNNKHRHMSAITNLVEGRDWPPSTNTGTCRQLPI